MTPKERVAAAIPLSHPHLHAPRIHATADPVGFVVTDDRYREVRFSVRVAPANALCYSVRGKAFLVMRERVYMEKDASPTLDSSGDVLVVK